MANLQRTRPHVTRQLRVERRIKTDVLPLYNATNQLQSSTVYVCIYRMKVKKLCLKDGINEFLLLVDEQVRVVLIWPAGNRLGPARVVVVVFKLYVTL